MAPPSNNQRLDSVEEGMAAMRQSIGSLQQALQKQFDEQMAMINEKLSSIAMDNVKLHSSIQEENVNLRSSIQEEVRTILTDSTQSNSGQRSAGSFNSNGGTGGAAMGGGGLNWRYRKLDMPLFDGVNPDGWIMRAERYFGFYRLTEDDKMEDAIVALEGDALLWFQWEHRRRPVKRWDELKSLLLHQFRPSQSGSLHEQWLSLTQVSTVLNYQCAFIELSAPLANVSEEIALGQFINGLRPDIRAEVRVFGPRTLDQAMALASNVEEKLKVSPLRRGDGKGYVPQSFGFGNSSTRITPSSSPVQNPNRVASNLGSAWSQTASRARSNSPLSSTVPTPPNGSSKSTGEVRRLSDKELQQKRERGLCFRCDEKWNVGHRCRRRELSVLLTQEEDEEEPGENEGVEEPVEVNQTEICLNSVMGITSPKTLKLVGMILGHEVVIMIDPGATHNFLSQASIREARLSYKN